MTIRTEAVEELERTLGEQVRRARLAQQLDQATLAHNASVSIGALRNLESGRGARIATLVRVLRALELEQWLETLRPPPELGPLDRLSGATAPPEPMRAPRRTATS